MDAVKANPEVFEEGRPAPATETKPMLWKIVSEDEMNRLYKKGEYFGIANEREADLFAHIQVLERDNAALRQKVGELETHEKATHRNMEEILGKGDSMETRARELKDDRDSWRDAANMDQDRATKAEAEVKRLGELVERAKETMGKYATCEFFITWLRDADAAKGKE